MAVDDHVAEQAEVVAQAGGGEPGHEFGRLSQFHLEDDGELAVGAEAREVHAGDVSQPFDGAGGVVERVEGGAAVADGVVHGAFEEGEQEVVFALEVEVDGAGGDVGAFGDVGDLGGEEAAFGEDLGGRVEDAVAFVGRRHFENE